MAFSECPKCGAGKSLDGPTFSLPDRVTHYCCGSRHFEQTAICAESFVQSDYCIIKEQLATAERERDIARRAMSLFVANYSEAAVTIDGERWGVYDLPGWWAAETLLPWCYAPAEAESEAKG